MLTWACPPHSLQEFIDAMRQLTDEVHWRGIGGPDDMSKVLLVPFAAKVRELSEESDFVFERKKGSAASARGAGASGWHLYNFTLPELVEQPTPFVDE